MVKSEANTYDIIFAGGGVAGCVAAGRLAEADPSLRILIVEAGAHTKEVPVHIQPARCFSNLIMGGKAFTHHMSERNPNLNNRPLRVTTGRCLGGGSGINFSYYSRGSASDYDDWANRFGNEGWAFEDLIPLFKKVETYQAEPDSDTHGTSGPIKVSIAQDQVNIAEEFLAVAAAYDPERGQTKDLYDFHTANKYGRWPRYIDLKSGRRSDVAHHYIYTQENNKNLIIKDRQRVVRVIFEGTKAVGVEFVSDVIGRDAKGVEGQTPEVAYASRLVVVSAGALGSPAILERSGIGAPAILKKNEIKQIIDLPGVGQNYMDHSLLTMPYLSGDDSDSLDSVLKGSAEFLKPHLEQWEQTGQGLIAHTGMDAGIRYRPSEEELKQFGPEFQARWNSYYRNALDKPIAQIGLFAAYLGGHPEAPRCNYLSIAYISVYPTSTGSVHIASGLNPYSNLQLDNGFLSTVDDLEILRFCYKKTREMARRNKYYRGELAVGHPIFPEESPATAKAADGPVPISAPDIKYSVQDDKAIDEFHREKVSTCWHSSGTCGMKPREKNGVVDSRLNVYDTLNLKVADMSIAPDNVGGNTYNTALAIGEKAAIIIAEDLGINGVTSA